MNLAPRACVGLTSRLRRAWRRRITDDLTVSAKSLPILVGVDAGATKAVAISVTTDGERLARVEGPGANPKRHGLDAAADRISALAARAADGRPIALLFVAGAGIDRPEHARALEGALRHRLRQDSRGEDTRDEVTHVIVVNDTLAVLRAGTPDAVGLAVPVSTGGNVIGRAGDGRVTDRGHGIFGGGYVLGALAARAARRGQVGEELTREVDAAAVSWRGRRPGPEAALLGVAVARAAERGDPYPRRMVDRWCARVADAVREEAERLDLGDQPAVIVYGGLAEASPWLANRICAAVLAGAPRARVVPLETEPAVGAAALALDAWLGTPIGWDFTPRR
jgi:N-acetylglucosamine kinase-like BadF-type ATPase